MRLEIKGQPVGKGRPRFNRYGATYTPDKTKDYEEYVKVCYKNKYNIKQTPTEKPLKAKITAFFEVPTSYSNKKKKELIGQPHAKKPDIDNISKIILDSLNGLAYKDDNQIVELEVKKLYGEEAKVILELEDVSNNK
ncbi:MAG: RusA family crossover junction endodeoxyribonuclease [Clostridia bacterium]|nr:RusA family crossover junction endodeoxyribonuclease [Clostridia bacterium]